MQSAPVIKTEMIPMPCAHAMAEGEIIEGSAPFCKTVRVTSGNEILETVCTEIHHHTDDNLDYHTHKTKLVGIALEGYRSADSDSDSEGELSSNFDLVMSLNKGKSKHSGLRKLDFEPLGSKPSGPEQEDASEKYLEMAAGFTPESWEVSGEFESTEPSPSSSSTLTFLAPEDMPVRKGALPVSPPMQSEFTGLSPAQLAEKEVVLSEQAEMLQEQIEIETDEKQKEILIKAKQDLVNLLKDLRAEKAIRQQAKSSKLK